MGLFLWDETDCAFNHREIDIEVSHWLDPQAENYQFVVQPYDTPGNRNRFVVADPSEPVTSRFLWDPQRIEFQSVGANTLAWLRKEDVGADWSYPGNDNPPAGHENVRLNLWLIGGQQPEYLEEIEFVIESFSFRSLFEIEGDINRDGRVDLFDVAELANRWLEDCHGIMSLLCRPTTLK